MAIRHDITLSTTEPNNDIGLLKIRQADEQTQTLVVQLTETSTPKSYEGLQPFFCAKLGQSLGLGIIEQKLNPEEMTDPQNGLLEYTFRNEDWQQIGRQVGYFSFRKMKDDGHEYVEQFTTRDFYFNITRNVFSEGLTEVKKDGSTYVWTIEDLIRLFNEYIASEKSDWEEFVDQNREVLESVDPGGLILSELIRSRKPDGAEAPYPDLPTRLDEQIGKNSEFRDFEADKSFMSRINTEFLERGINVKNIGAKSEGSEGFDNTDIFKQAIELVPSGGILFIPDGNYKLTEQLIINKPMSIVCTNNTSCILNFKDSSGFLVASSGVSFQNVRMYLTKTLTTNDFVGVEVKNETGQNENFDLQNCDISNFDIGLKITNAWNFNIVKTKLTFVRKYGIWAIGKSVNNHISDTNISRNSSEFEENNKGIFFDGAENPSEGWTITNSVIFGFDILIHSQRMSHVLVSNCILDYARKKAVLLESFDLNVSCGWQFNNNYIATENGEAAIHDYQGSNNIQHGNFFSNNKILDYSGTGEVGILTSEKALNDIIIGNRVLGYGIDIDVRNQQHIVSNNVCLSKTLTNGANILALENSLITNNIGSVSQNNSYSNISGHRMYMTSSANLPSQASEGDLVFNARDVYANTLGWRRTNGMWEPLNIGSIKIVTVLPTASSAYRGNYLMVGGVGGVPDKVYICIYAGTVTGYTWKEVAMV